MADNTRDNQRKINQIYNTDISKFIIKKLEYEMLDNRMKKKYVKCDLCDEHYFRMEQGGIYEPSNKINVCDYCLIIPKRISDTYN